jgi:1L-myo-inositol 1-phosphate cytidylyltransferase / CDP-L-myo-inositol myo-inositolphosphotransferase
MPKLKSQNPILAVLETVFAVLPLSPPTENWSVLDWYSKKICGIPFLIRNIINIQRAGVNTLIILSKTDNVSLYKKLCKEKKITLKLIFKTDIAEVIKVTQGDSLVILNSNALHTQQEIESCISFKNKTNEALLHSIDSKSITEALTKLTLGEEILLPQPSDNHNSRIIFLPGKKKSRISTSEDFLIQQKNLIQSSGLNNDSFMDKAITRFFSRQLTRLFLKTPLSPNMITILSLFIGLISSIFFYHGTYKDNMIGAFLLIISAWVDCTDGEIARLKFSESKIGAKLDITCDNLVHFSVFFAIGMGLYQSTGNTIFILFGLFAVFGSLISFLCLSASIIDSKKKISANTTGLEKKKTLTDNLANRDFIYFLFFMSLIGKIDVFICVTAFGANIFAFYLSYLKIKPILGIN